MNRARIHCLQILLLATGLTAWGLQTGRLYPLKYMRIL